MKTVYVIGTGGTIAGVGDAAGGYRAGVLPVEALLERVAQLGELNVPIKAESLACIGSQDMSEAVWFTLARRIAELRSAADCAGIVIIHGTDTMEETAFFLDCVLPQASPPVVLTGAMLPATAPDADGPGNIYAAVAVAASAASQGRGVLVVMNGEIHSAQTVAKTHTRSLAAFASAEGSASGKICSGDVVYNAPATHLTPASRKNVSASDNDAAAVLSGAPVAATGRAGSSLTAAAPASGIPDSDAPLVSSGTFVAVPSASSAVPPQFDLDALAAAFAAQGALPKIGIAMAYVGASPELVAALVAQGCRGIVYAGFGNGNCSAQTLAALQAAQRQGVVIVRASRVPFGAVTACGEVDDTAHGFIAGGRFSPVKARILLSLALARGDSFEAIRSLFA